MEGSLPRGVVFSWPMGDARHKRPYPKGDGIQTTAAWKRKALERMHQLGISPAEMARQLNADPTGLGRLLRSKRQVTSKYVTPISSILGIDPPSSLPSDDELALILASLTPEQRKKAAAIIRLSLSLDE